MLPHLDSYRLIVADYTRRIEDRELLTGEALPSEAELADKYRTDLNLAAYALYKLHEANLVHKIRGVFYVR